jgi:AhpD family alkylhydroperoxidase
MSHLAARIDFPQFKALAPAVYAGMSAVTQAINASGLPKDLAELLKVRASQINGCAFCCQFHLTHARAAHVPQTKLELVEVWRDTPLFSSRERAALAWTEALTKMAEAAPDESIYKSLQAEFSETEIAHLTAAIGLINAWNRIAAGLLFTPVIPTATPA